MAESRFGGVPVEQQPKASRFGGVPVEQARDERSAMQYVDDVVRQIANGATFGFGDEIAASLSSLTGIAEQGGPGAGLDANLAAERSRDRQFMEDEPFVATASQIAGAVPTAMLPFGALGRTASAGIGAGEGAVYGFGTGEGGFESRAKEAGKGALIGGGTAMLAPVVGAASRGVAQRRAANAAIRNAPSTQDLRRGASAAYDRARAAGVSIAPQKLRQFADDLAMTLQQEGLDSTLHPRATAILQRFDMTGNATNQAMPDLTTLRRLAGQVAGSTDADERRLGQIMLDRFDDLVENLSPADVTGGNVANIADDLAEARTSWSRMRKSEMADTAIDKAGKQASGVENGLRVQFRQILNNPRARRGLTADEISAMEEVVQGTFTSNTLRRLGRLGLGSGAQHNMLGGGLAASGGAAVGASLAGPAGAGLGAGIPMAGGYLAQRGAEALTGRSAELARALMATGGKIPTPAAPSQTGRLVQQLLQRNAPFTAQLRDPDPMTIEFGAVPGRRFPVPPAR